MNRTLTRRIAFSEQFNLFVGIDLGKQKNEAIILDRQLRIHGRYKFAHNRADYDKLAEWLQKSRGIFTTPRILIGMEPTNDYWQWLATYLERVNIPYRMVNAFTVKKSREGLQLDYAKDDRRDALTIARLLREGQFTETQLLSETYAQMRFYEQAIWGLKSKLRQQKNMLRQNTERLFPELRQAFKDFTGQTALALLQNHANPQVIAAMSWQEFEASVRRDLKEGSRLMVKKLRQVYELAPDSIGLQSGQALQLLIQQQIATLSFQQQQLAELAQALLALFHTLPHAPAMLSLGLGEVTTACIAAELGDPSCFSSAKQWVKLAGIQPSNNQSGQYERQKTPMSHKGRARLRSYLFFATMRLIRTDATFKAKQQDLINRARQPLKRLEAVGALMNKLLHLMWAVCKKQTVYSPELFAKAT